MHGKLKIERFRIHFFPPQNQTVLLSATRKLESGSERASWTEKQIKTTFRPHQVFTSSFQ